MQLWKAAAIAVWRLNSRGDDLPKEWVSDRRLTVSLGECYFDFDFPIIDIMLLSIGVFVCDRWIDSWAIRAAERHLYIKEFLMKANGGVIAWSLPNICFGSVRLKIAQVLRGRVSSSLRQYRWEISWFKWSISCPLFNVNTRRLQNADDWRRTHFSIMRRLGMTVSSSCPRSFRPSATLHSRRQWNDAGAVISSLPQAKNEPVWVLGGSKSFSGTSALFVKPPEVNAGQMNSFTPEEQLCSGKSPYGRFGRSCQNVR